MPDARTAFEPLHGALIRSRKAGAFRLTETRHAGGTQLPLHAHARPSACFVVGGSFLERRGRLEVPCAAASLVLRAAGTEHDDRFGPRGARCFNVEVEAGDEGEGDGTALDARGRWTSAARLLVAFRSDASDLELEALAWELFGGDDRARAETRRPRWLDRVLDVIEARVTERLLLSDLAAVAGVHPMHLARVFRRTMGCSVGAWLRDRRVARAAEALARSEGSIARAAVDAGFADHAHLSRVFRRRAGVSPSAYRALFAGGGFDRSSGARERRSS